MKAGRPIAPGEHPREKARRSATARRAGRKRSPVSRQPAEVQERILRLHLEGRSTREIARELRLSRNAILRVLHRPEARRAMKKARSALFDEAVRLLFQRPAPAQRPASAKKPPITINITRCLAPSLVKRDEPPRLDVPPSRIAEPEPEPEPEPYWMTQMNAPTKPLAMYFKCPQCGDLLPTGADSEMSRHRKFYCRYGPW